MSFPFVSKLIIPCCNLKINIHLHNLFILIRSTLVHNMFCTHKVSSLNYTCIYYAVLLNVYLPLFVL